jgi:hypothetical protein
MVKPAQFLRISERIIRTMAPSAKVVACICVAAALAFGAARVEAAEATFPLGSRIGLTPPTGFSASNAFPGFEDRDRKAAILLFELPREAYTEIEKSMTVDNLKKQGLTVEKREDFTIDGGKAFLVTATQDTGGSKLGKWLLLASIGDVTAMVNAQIPEAAMSAYPDAAIRSALASVKVRPTPIEEQLSLLPFKAQELAGFRVIEVAENKTLVLADRPQDATDVIQYPQMVIGAAATPTIEPNDRANFAREAMSTLTAFTDMRITFSEPMRLGGQQGYEIRVDAKDVRTGTDVSIVQWLRFGTGGVVRMVGVAPKDKWAAAFPRFRAIRDGIAPR